MGEMYVALPHVHVDQSVSLCLLLDSLLSLLLLLTVNVACTSRLSLGFK